MLTAVCVELNVISLEAMAETVPTLLYVTVVPVMVLKSSLIPATQSKLKAALSSAIHASNPITRMEALEAIKSASVKLALLRN